MGFRDQSILHSCVEEPEFLTTNIDILFRNSIKTLHEGLGWSEAEASECLAPGREGSGFGDPTPET